MLLRFDHVASLSVNANQSASGSFPRRPQCDGRGHDEDLEHANSVAVAILDWVNAFQLRVF